MIEERVRSLLEKLYFHELEHREKINSRLQMPFAITLALLGGYSFLWSKARLGDLQHCVGIFYALVGLFSFLLFVSGAIQFKRAWIGHEYEVLPPGGELLSHSDILKAHYRNAGYGRNYADREFRGVELNYFAKCASKNFEVNEKRSLSLHKANRLLLFSGYLLVLALILVLAERFSDVEKRPVVDVNLVGSSWSKEMSEQKPLPPPPPPPPPTRLIKEGVELPRPSPPPPPPKK